MCLSIKQNSVVHLYKCYSPVPSISVLVLTVGDTNNTQLNNEKLGDIAVDVTGIE